jgi:hypothetical protein
LLICAIIFIIVWKIKNPDIQKDVLTNMVPHATCNVTCNIHHVNSPHLQKHVLVLTYGTSIGTHIEGT